MESAPFLHYELHVQINAYFAGINLSKQSLKKPDMRGDNGHPVKC